MKFPLPGRKSFGTQPASSSASPIKRFVWPLAYLAIFLVALVASFHLFFPGNLVQARLSSELNTRLPFSVQLRGTQLEFPFRLQVGELRIVTPESWTVPQFTNLILAPIWSSLSGNAGTEIEAATPGGGVQATVYQSGDLQLVGNGLGFSIPLSQFSLSLAGSIDDTTLTVTPKGDADIDLDLATSLARLDLVGLKDLGMEGDVLRLGEGKLQVTGDRKELEVAEFSLSGGDLGVNVSGTLQPGTTAQNTRLNLAVTLVPTDTLDSSLKQMLGLVARPSRDGSIRFRLTGTLAAPRTK
ncbi:MAG: type II secretion system protein GspN [Desulfuromonas sp.]|nr:MAG: type II secretion system protein GspN [Desulfuromonas sp.]